MKRHLQELGAALIIALVLVEMAVLATHAYGAGPDCASDYAAMWYSFEDGRATHVVWIDLLEWDPSYPVPADVGSLAQQRAYNELYFQREWATWYMAMGDATYVPWLRANLEEGRALHQQWADYVRSGGAAQGSAELNDWWAGVYTWRLATLDRMVQECR